MDRRIKLFEDMSKEWMHELSDVHDDILYMTDGGHMTGNISSGLRIFDDIYYAIKDAPKDEVPSEALKLMNEIKSEIDGLKGINEKIVKLYTLLTGELY